MEYNTQRAQLVIPEYGRNVQNMVAYALTVENREERNKVAQAIVSVMGQVNPDLAGKEELVNKLWVHMYIISDYQLDVDYPCDIPEREEFEMKPPSMNYPQSKIKYGHYGKTVEKFIEHAKTITDEEDKKEVSLTIANMMKRFYLTFHNNSVEDEMIKKQLERMSDGTLKVDEETQLNSTGFILKTLGHSGNNNNYKKKKTNNNNNRNRRNQHQNRNRQQGRG